MMYDDKTHLEQTVAKLQADGIETQTQLKQLITQVILLLQKQNTPLSVPASFPSNGTGTPRAVRPVSPPDFNGDRTKGIGFLNSCQTYLHLCPGEFRDEQTKIVWAMSYMKTSRAQKWTARVFRWEEQPENSGQYKFLDWEDFTTEFKKEFVPAHSDALAVNRLESTAYYQKARPLDDYIDEFQDLIADSGYTDPKTVVVKFRRGLNGQIQNSVATMASGRPSDASPAQWYTMARTVDENRAANEVFSSTYRSSVPASRPPATSVIRPFPTPVRPGHSHIVPTPGNPVPMDLDAARRVSNTPLCFRCKKPGHYGRDCPTQFDV
jgi:hypothetical protein